jgi:indole-3-glycerol phosphate synthase
MDVLATIVAGVRKSVEEREQAVPMAQLRKEAAARRPNGTAFRASIGADGVRVIAECKRRSPSKGVLRGGYDPVAIALGYESAGAAAISVLTEPSFFDGEFEHLSAVRDAVTLPLLQKDFVVTRYQILEARRAGADAILLIATALGPSLPDLLSAARDEGLQPIVEVHSASELGRALDAGADIVGVNSRNLRTLEVDLGLFDALIDQIPDTVIAVAESGLRNGADVRRLREAGFDAFLVGERFMTAPKPDAALASFLADALTEEASA